MESGTLLGVSRDVIFTKLMNVMQFAANGP